MKTDTPEIIHPMEVVDRELRTFGKCMVDADAKWTGKGINWPRIWRYAVDLWLDSRLDTMHAPNPTYESVHTERDKKCNISFPAHSSPP